MKKRFTESQIVAAFKKQENGITGNTSFGRLLNDPGVVETAVRAMDIVFEKTGAARHGFFTVDLKEDVSGVPKVTEINVRHIAFTQCFAAGGANLAEDTIRLLDGDTAFNREYLMYRFEEGLIYLRDVDVQPVVMHANDVLRIEPSRAGSA